MTFFPRMAFSAENEIVAIRTGIQPGNKTRLVIETTRRPDYSLSYPNRQLVVSVNAKCSAKPSLIDGTLIDNIDIQKGLIVANLRKTIQPIPRAQIMVLEPTGASKYRLVLDFAAGKAAAKTAAAADAAISGKSASRKPTIVIDPGHGGKDPGCIGTTGTREKDIVLAVSKKLSDRLKSAGYNVYMTRTNDTFLNLDTRSGIAEKRKADLFMSIHANSNPKKTVKGFSIYTLSKTASDAEAQKLADAENAADKIAVDGFRGFEPEVRNILSHLQQTMITTTSIEFADKVLGATRSTGIVRVDGAQRSAPFAVLKSTIPSCLVELGHLSNRDEEKLLKSSDYQNKLVNTLASAVGKYESVA